MFTTGVPKDALPDEVALYLRFQPRHLPVSDAFASATRRTSDPFEAAQSSFLEGYRNPARAHAAPHRYFSSAGVWEHIADPLELIWVAEAFAVSPSLVATASRAAEGAPGDGAACALIREAIPWETVATAPGRPCGHGTVIVSAGPLHVVDGTLRLTISRRTTMTAINVTATGVDPTLAIRYFVDGDEMRYGMVDASTAHIALEGAMLDPGAHLLEVIGYVGAPYTSSEAFYRSIPYEVLLS